MRISKPLLALGLITAFGNSLLPAQQSSNQSCAVPLVVSRFVPSSETVELVKDLRARDLTIQLAGRGIAVESASVDSGPKRVALILDASGQVSEEEWKLETEMAASLLEHARSEDKFALFLVGVGIPESHFLSSTELRARLQMLASSRPSTNGTEKTYDSLVEAAKFFDPAEFGDSIFFFGHPEDAGSKSTSDRVEELILKERLRFYAMSFTDPFAALPKDFNPNKRLPASFSTGKADEISHATGYFFSFHSPNVLRMQGQSALLKGFLGDLYAGIAEPYRVQISVPINADRTPLKILLSEAEKRRVHQEDIRYPHFIYPCGTRVAAAADSH